MKLGEIKNISFSKLLYNKSFTIPFSILASVIFWLVITITQNPIRESIITDIPITISVEGSAVAELGLDVIGGELDTKVSVRVSGPSYIISTLTGKDIIVSASLSNVTLPGNYNIELVAARNSSKSGYTILGTNPSTIPLVFDSIDTKEYEVKAVANGVVAVAGLVSEPAITTDSQDSTIEIKGPRSEIEKIATVEAVADVNRTLSATESFDAALVLKDVNGNTLDNAMFTVKKNTIKISVPISRRMELTIKAVFQNAPEILTNGQLLYTLSEDTITIIGPPETVDEMTEVTLAPINFENVSISQNSFDVALKLPTAVKTADNIESVTVKISTNGISEKTFTVNEFVSKDLAEGLTMAVAGNLKNAKLCGVSSDIFSLQSTDIYAELDLAGKTAGEYTVTTVIKVRNKNSIWQVGTYSVVVTIK